MKEVAQLLNEMIAKGVIIDYAVFGAVAQMRYTEAVATMDADVLIALPPQEGLDILRPVYDFCAARGWHPEGEAVRVGDWPVQFIPAFSPVTEEAMQQADTGEIYGVPIRVVRADYLAVIALSTGRAKDFARILALLECDVVTQDEIGKLVVHLGLQSKWTAFREKFLEK